MYSGHPARSGTESDLELGRKARPKRFLTTFAVLLLATLLLFSGASATLAATNVSGTISTDTTWTTAGSPYVISGTVIVSTGVTLTLQPGVVVKGTSSSASLYVAGTLVADGTPTSPIVFTSIKDDTVGGDTNGDGGGTLPAAGDWKEILFQSTSTGSVLDYVEVRYSGALTASIRVDSSGLSITNSAVVDGDNYGIYVYSNASPTITDNTIARNDHGIRLDGSSASVIGNTIRDNGTYGIYLSNSPGAIITGNTLTGNGSYGIYNATTSFSVLAPGNYWGDPSGPYDPSDDQATGGLYNPDGLGDRVTDGVLYSSWLSYDPNVPDTAPVPALGLWGHALLLLLLGGAAVGSLRFRRRGR
jgi:parallel beta-helix repeat protein